MLTVGQVLLFVPADNRWSGPYEVTVEKVGRRWATMSRGCGRVDINTLIVDGAGYSSPGRCYLSREEWESRRRADAAWKALCRHMERARWKAPDHLNAADIAKAAEALGITLPIEASELV
jgi:hypothetical protein